MPLVSFRQKFDEGRTIYGCDKNYYTGIVSSVGFKNASSLPPMSPVISILSPSSLCIEASLKKEWVPTNKPEDPSVHQKILARSQNSTNELTTLIAIDACFCVMAAPLILQEPSFVALITVIQATARSAMPIKAPGLINRVKAKSIAVRRR